MKKFSLLWLLPLAAALFFIIPSDLSALTDRQEKQLTDLQAELQTKGRLSNSKQKTLDNLLAQKQAEAPAVPAVPAVIPEQAPREEEARLNAQAEALKQAQREEEEWRAQLDALKEAQEDQAWALQQAQEETKEVREEAWLAEKAQAEALEQVQNTAKEAQEAARLAQEVLKQAQALAVPEPKGAISEPAAPQQVISMYPRLDSSSSEDPGSGPAFVSPAPQRPGPPDDTPIPAWVLDPNRIKNDILSYNYANTDPNRDERIQAEFDSMVFGIGSAKSSATQLSIQMAEARARQDIAFQVGTQIQAKITDFTENQGNKYGSEFNFSQDSVTERIGQQLTDIELKGLRVLKREKAPSPDSTWWVLVAWPKAAAVVATETIAEKVIEAEVIAPIVRARAAAQLLDDQLDKAKLKSAAVSE